MEKPAPAALAVLTADQYARLTQSRDPEADQRTAGEAAAVLGAFDEHHEDHEPSVPEPFHAEQLPGQQGVQPGESREDVRGVPQVPAGEQDRQAHRRRLEQVPHGQSALPAGLLPHGQAGQTDPDRKGGQGEVLASVQGTRR